MWTSKRGRADDSAHYWDCLFNKRQLRLIAGLEAGDPLRKIFFS